MCRRWGGRIHDQVHEVLLFFEGNVSLLLNSIAFVKLEPALTLTLLLVVGGHYKPSIKSHSQQGVKDGGQTFSQPAVAQARAEQSLSIRSPLFTFPSRTAVGIVYSEWKCLKSGYDGTLPVRCWGKSNDLEFGRHGFSLRVEANASLNKPFTLPGTCVCFFVYYLFCKRRVLQCFPVNIRPQTSKISNFPL